MGHVDFMAAVSGLPSNHVFDLEVPGTLDAKRRLAFPFARKLSREPETITKADVDALRPEFDDKQIVQLIFAICHFNTMNRLALGFGVPLEQTNVFAPPAKAAASGAGGAAGKPTSPPVPPPSEPKSAAPKAQ